MTMQAIGTTAIMLGILAFISGCHNVSSKCSCSDQTVSQTTNENDERKFFRELSTSQYERSLVLKRLNGRIGDLLHGSTTSNSWIDVYEGSEGKFDIIVSGIYDEENRAIVEKVAKQSK